MVSSNVIWIKIGLVFACFASFTEARIDSTNAVTNNFYVKENSRNPIIPASTILLSQNDFNQPNFYSPTRDQLYRIQRHTYKFSPFGFDRASNALLPYHLSLYDPTSTGNYNPFEDNPIADNDNPFAHRFYNGPIDPPELSLPNQSIDHQDTIEVQNIFSDSDFHPQAPSPKTKLTDESTSSIVGKKSFPSMATALDSILKLQEQIEANKISRNPTTKTLPLPKIKAEPLLDPRFAESSAPESEQASDPKNVLAWQKRIKYIRKGQARKYKNKKVLSKFKIFRAVPDQDV